MSGRIQWVPRSGRSWGLVGGVLATIITGVAIMAGPVRKSFASIDDAIMESEKQVARNLRILAPVSRDAVRKQYADFGERIKKRGSTAEENAAMLAEIEKIASGEGIALAATKPREPKVDSYGERYEVEMEFDADMVRCIRFLYALESSPQLLKVERVAVDSRKGPAAAALRAVVLVSKVVTL